MVDKVVLLFVSKGNYFLQTLVLMQRPTITFVSAFCKIYTGATYWKE